jgi:hypothetical protein
MQTLESLEQINEFEGSAEVLVQTHEHGNLGLGRQRLRRHHELHGWRRGTVEERLPHRLEYLQATTSNNVIIIIIIIIITVNIA